jgi:hypothetical protein
MPRPGPGRLFVERTRPGAIGSCLPGVAVGIMGGDFLLAVHGGAAMTRGAL